MLTPVRIAVIITLLNLMSFLVQRSSFLELNSIHIYCRCITGFANSFVEIIRSVKKNVFNIVYFYPPCLTMWSWINLKLCKPRVLMLKPYIPIYSAVVSRSGQQTLCVGCVCVCVGGINKCITKHNNFNTLKSR